MSYFRTARGHVMEISAPLPKDIQVRILNWGVRMSKPNKGKGLYLVTCNNAFKCNQVEKVLDASGFVPVIDSMDDGSTIWTPVRMCDLRSS
jgi:hypothetical protein